MRRIFNILLISLGLLLASLVHAENVQEFRLKNGLKIFVKEDHRAPVVMSSIWYKVGSGYEYGGITGISHVLEHMMFKGTKRYGPGEFSKIIANQGGQENAFTSYDYTGYYQMIAADKLPICFRLEADRMHNLLLQKGEFSKELQVVMEERRLRTDDNPQGLTYERFAAAAHVANPYHHPIIGWMDDVSHLTVKDLRKWYQRWYVPNNAMIVVVGDVKPKEVFKLAKKYFGDLKAAPIPVVKTQREVPSLGRRIVSVSVPAKLPWLIMGYNVPVLNSAKLHWEPYALVVLSAILSEGDSARLPKELVRDQQIATNINVSYSPYKRLNSLFVINGTPAQGHTVSDLQRALLAQIKRLQDEQVTAKELSRVKALVIADDIYQKDSIRYQGYKVGALETVGLSWREGEQFVQRIKEITPAQIQAVAEKYLVTKRLTEARLKPLPIKAGVRVPTYKGGQSVH